MTRAAGQPKGGIRHPFSRGVYTREDADRVRVTLPDGTFGVFDGIGRWIEGEVFEADPELCIWMSINRAEVSHRLSPQHAKPKRDD